MILPEQLAFSVKHDFGPYPNGVGTIVLATWQACNNSIISLTAWFDSLLAWSLITLTSKC